ncbi:protein phosphatase 2C domain-containing protein [Nocardioides sp. W3-2-3]|uniref:protein phosphatase 2C domain-containing protein n=1 Tax=Nocardioides convexus TaxID=2712224 RepID=UPI0024188D8C|nr:protein phosphatase 2C domain-containing protein [Nocardioides convexus]NHA00164.1 protein phosphatase 2C domain-containing protein [Nocardioides convexus]
MRHHAEAHPFTAPELTLSAARDPLRPYGSTILAAAALPGLVLLLQIGDGDTVLVSSAGEAARPLPEDGDLDGVHTRLAVPAAAAGGPADRRPRRGGAGRGAGLPHHRRLREASGRCVRVVARDR